MRREKEKRDVLLADFKGSIEGIQKSIEARLGWRVSRELFVLAVEYSVELREGARGFGVSDIHLVRRPEREGKGASTGLAYVKFESPAEAAQAKTACHRASMGSRYIECMIHTGGHRANGKLNYQNFRRPPPSDNFNFFPLFS